MGDVIRSFPVRSSKEDKPRLLKFYFDTGSPYTFVKRSACKGFVNLSKLGAAVTFHGMGNGRFLVREMLNMEVRLLGIWCRHIAYVVEDSVLEQGYDILVGHDFIQRFDITIRARGKRKALLLNRGALLMAQRIR